MRLVSLGLGLAAVLGLTQEPEDVSPEGEHQRLAEYVDGLDGFTVRYSVFPWERDPVELRMVYAAPDRATLRIASSEGTMTLWLVEGVMAWLSESGDEIGFGSFDVGSVFGEWRDVRVALNEAFGGREPRPVDPSPAFHVHPDDETGDGEPRFTFQLQLATGNTSFFCWNGVHRDVFEKKTLDGGHLVLHASGEDSTIKVSREFAQGFLELAFGEGESGPVTMRLDGVDLEVDEAELEIPEAPEGANDLTEGLAAGARAMAGPAAVRRNVLGRMHRRLEEGDVEWDDDTRELAAGVFEAFHRHGLPAHYQEWMEETRDSIRATAERLREIIERGDAPSDELAAGVAHWKETFTSKLREGAEAYAAKLTPPDLEGDWFEALIELEREVSRALYAETIIDPLIEDFESEVEGQL